MMLERWDNSLTVSETLTWSVLKIPLCRWNEAFTMPAVLYSSDFYTMKYYIRKAEILLSALLCLIVAGFALPVTHHCVSPRTLVWLKHSFIDGWVKQCSFSRVKGTHISIAKEENCATASKRLTCFYKAHLYYNSIDLHLSYSSIIVSFYNLVQKNLVWYKGYCTWQS